MVFNNGRPFESGGTVRAANGSQYRLSLEDGAVAGGIPAVGCRCGAGCRQRIVLHNLDATPTRGRPGSCPICTRPQSTAHNTPDGDQFLLSSPGLISFATGAPARRHGSPYQIDPLSHTIRHETVRFKTVTI